MVKNQTESASHACGRNAYKVCLVGLAGAYIFYKIECVGPMDRQPP